MAGAESSVALPAVKRPPRWLFILLIFVVAGPPIGAAFGMICLWATDLHRYISAQQLIGATLISLRGVPRWLGVSYLAAPPALLTGGVLVLIERRMNDWLAAGIILLAGATLSAMDFALMSIFFVGVRPDLGGAIIFAGIGAMAGIDCFLLIRWFTTLAGKAGQDGAQPRS